MKFFKPTVLVGILFAFLACDHSASDSKKDLLSIATVKSEENEYNKVTASGDQISDTSQIPSQKQKSQIQGKTTLEPKIDWDKKIIKIASVDLEVKNYKSFSDLLHSNIKKFGGYIAREEQNQTDYKIENTVSIKVPVDQFDDLVTSLTEGEQKLIEKKITSDDVTTEVVDTRSRMEAKKQVRLKYLDLLKQARNMEEILNVQKEINSIQEDIEAATGRVEYLSHSASFSTINLTFFQILDASAKDESKISYASKLWQSFKNGWNWIGDFIIGLTSIWPLFILGFACWFTYKKWIASKPQKRNA
jgi:hypothetical protein